MAEKQLTLLKHVNQTPVMAKCSRCELKFFVPKRLIKDLNTARSYLLSKFDQHICKLPDNEPRTRFRNRG